MYYDIIIKGYTGEISAAVAGSCIVILFIVSLVVYRNWKYEQELDSLLWKIDFKEIVMPEAEKENNSQKQTRVNKVYSFKKKVLFVFFYFVCYENKDIIINFNGSYV